MANSVKDYIDLYARFQDRARQTLIDAQGSDQPNPMGEKMNAWQLKSYGNWFESIAQTQLCYMSHAVINRNTCNKSVERIMLKVRIGGKIKKAREVIAKHTGREAAYPKIRKKTAVI
jgi:hypothetical protein